MVGWVLALKSEISEILEKSLHKKMKFSMKNFFSKCDQIRSETADLVTFTEEILNGKLHSLFSVTSKAL